MFIYKPFVKSFIHLFIKYLLNDVTLGARELNTNQISSYSGKRSQVYRRDIKQNSLGVWREKKVLFYG